MLFSTCCCGTFLLIGMCSSFVAKKPAFCRHGLEATRRDFLQQATAAVASGQLVNNNDINSTKTDAFCDGNKQLPITQQDEACRQLARPSPNRSTRSTGSERTTGSAGVLDEEPTPSSDKTGGASSSSRKNRLKKSLRTNRNTRSSSISIGSMARQSSATDARNGKNSATEGDIQSRRSSNEGSMSTASSSSRKLSMSNGGSMVMGSRSSLSSGRNGGSRGGGGSSQSGTISSEGSMSSASSLSRSRSRKGSSSGSRSMGSRSSGRSGGSRGSGGRSGSGCFPADAIVLIQDVPTPIHQVKLGDSICSAKETYSAVYAFGLRMEYVRADFIRLSVNNTFFLELTENHLVFVGADREPVMAEDAVVGNELLHVPSNKLMAITSIQIVTKAGLYHPYTIAGTIVVNDFLVSVHSIDEVEAVVEVLDHQLFDLHTFQQLLFAPLRLACSLSPENYCGDQNYSRDGSHHFVDVLEHVQVMVFAGKTEANVLEAGPLVFWAFNVVALLVLTIASAVEMACAAPWSTLFCVCCAAAATILLRSKYRRVRTIIEMSKLVLE